MKEVKGMMISENVTYTGEVMSDGYQDVPHGMGMMKYSDHNELGRFQDGELNGVGYINYHEYMYVGMVHDGHINGWGLKAERGGFTFGIFEDSKIKVNLTPLAGVLWSKAMEEAGHFKRSATYVRKNGEIFVGAPQYLFYGEFGFHFLDNGEVFVGRKEYDEKGLTGKFLHFDCDYNITKGEYKDGVLVRVIDDSEFVSACEFFVNHKYIDFDINMNYNPNNFLFGEKKLLHVVEAGKTPTNIILKANIGHVIGNRFECQGGVNEETVWFMFPNDDDYLEDRLMNIANGDNPWMPDFSEYCVEFFNDFREANNNHQVVYKHISCYDEDADYDLDVFDYEFSTDDEDGDYMSSKNRTLASYYTDVHPAGFAFHIDGILGNLWEATNPKGKKEYFLMPHDECWNTMCSISNNHRNFCPNPDDFVLDFADLYVDLSEIYNPAKDEKMVWVYKM